jgi:hypothetical protein
MNDYDLRQLTRMRQQIDSYRDGSIGLSILIGDLIFLRDALSEVEKEWEKEFTDRIVDLESAYSYVLEKNAGKLDLITQKIVDDTIPKLLSLIEKKQTRSV